MANINDFKATLKGGGARANQFTITLPFPGFAAVGGETRVMSFLCKATNLPWGVIFPNVGTFARHPSQIYEAILEGIVLFILINFFALKKQLLLKAGYISGLFLIFYSIARIIGENFREPDKHLGYFFNYFSMGVILSFITFLAGCFIIFFIKKNEQNN